MLEQSRASPQEAGTTRLVADRPPKLLLRILSSNVPTAKQELNISLPLRSCVPHESPLRMVCGILRQLTAIYKATW